MIFEILSTASLGAVAGSAYYFQNKSASNDHEKIIKIADAAGLKVGKESIRIYRRRHDKKKGFAEYVYKIPLGLSFKQFVDNKQLFIDGLNNKSRTDINLANLKTIDWKGDILSQIKAIFNNRILLDKQLEIEYDGMLRFRVYEQGLGDSYEVNEELFDACKPWNIPMGVTLNGRIFHDFESQSGSHVLFGGATDMGKSTILNVAINALLHNHSDDVSFTLIDLKGGLEFGEYEDLRQVKHFATSVSEAESILESVRDEMEATFQVLRKKRKRNVKQAGIRKRHFVIIDEAAELSSAGELDADVKKAKINCENYIKDIARRGRASGMRLLYSTQYPTTETISSQVKRNLITRVSLAVDTATASGVVLDEGGAEKLPLIAGRAIYKRHRTQVMQAYKIDDNFIEKNIAPHIVIKGVPSSDVRQPARTDSFTIKAL